jgi:hypothetical protein
MNITLTIDTAKPLSDQDKTVLLAVAGAVPTETEVRDWRTDAATLSQERQRETVTEPSTPEPEEKPVRRRRKTTVTEPVQEPKPDQPTLPEKVEEPEPEDEAPVEDDEPEETGDATLESAVKRATELIGDGRGKEVREVLNSIGVKRVAELKGAKIQQFLDAL